MFKVQLDIIHKGCWGSEIGKKFPKLEFSSIDCRWVKGNVAHILKAEGDKSNFNKIILYLKKRKDVLSVEILSKDNNQLYLRILTKESKSVKHFSNLFFKTGCFPIAPTRFEDIYEKWTLGSSSRRNITKIYNLLKKKHKVKIKYIKEETIEAKLTQKQREALAYALHFGHYEWPRKKSISEICKILTVSKTVFLSHLRKAENKIIKEYNRP